MATKNTVTHICEHCDEMSKTYETWKEASEGIQSAGWMMMKASAWHHFCDDCSKEIQELIANWNGSKTQSTQGRADRLQQLRAIGAPEQIEFPTPSEVARINQKAADEPKPTKPKRAKKNTRHTVAGREIKVADYNPKPKKADKPDKPTLKQTEAHLEQIRRLSLFRHQAKDHYEELPSDDYVFVKHQDRGNWVVAKYSQASFQRYKEYADSKKAYGLQSELDRAMAAAIERDD